MSHHHVHLNDRLRAVIERDDWRQQKQITLRCLFGEGRWS